MMNWAQTKILTSANLSPEWKCEHKWIIKETSKEKYQKYLNFELKYYNLIKTEKDASRTKVIEIFPYVSSQLSKKKDSNKADAVLIASFFYNTYKKAE